ncbi:hypothetical protein [Oleiharenicola lentus]|uniref:hypothetical protein n=1 Tax=Oleiharenicola lentus TaxID=2508720 RepID=UPI003F6612A2
MKRVYFFLLACLALETWGVTLVFSGQIPPWLIPFEVGCLCLLTAGIGGIVYCLRGLYVNTCAGAGWNERWMLWYFTRPIVSLVCGAVSYLLLKAGLLVLDSAPRAESNHLGFYVLAFIAGLNVDKFLTKIEEVAQTTWGIEKSRSARVQDLAPASPATGTQMPAPAKEAVS